MAGGAQQLRAAHTNSTQIIDLFKLMLSNSHRGFFNQNREHKTHSGGTSGTLEGKDTSRSHKQLAWEMLVYQLSTQQEPDPKSRPW